MGESMQEQKLAIFTFSVFPFIGICNLIWKWSLLYLVTQKLFCLFFKVKKSAGGTEKTICYGYIPIFLRQSQGSADSSTGWVQKYPAKGASEAKPQLYLAGQILYPRSCDYGKDLLLICAKALMG